MNWVCNIAIQHFSWWQSTLLNYQKMHPRFSVVFCQLGTPGSSSYASSSSSILRNGGIVDKLQQCHDFGGCSLYHLRVEPKIFHDIYIAFSWKITHTSKAVLSMIHELPNLKPVFHSYSKNLTSTKASPNFLPSGASHLGFFYIKLSSSKWFFFTHDQLVWNPSSPLLQLLWH